MKTAKLPLLQILFVSFLICCCVKANKNQKILLDPSLGVVKGLSIPFGPIYQPGAPNYSQLGFLLKFPGENFTIPVIINMKSNGIWINNSTLSPWKFYSDCSPSQTCKNQGHSEHTWSEKIYQEVRPIFTLAGTLMKEQVSFEGGLTLPNTDILIANYGNDKRSRHYLESFFGVFGLSFRRSCVDAPTFFDFLKIEGIIEKSIFSIYLDASDHGELLFGGYDSKRAGSDFHYVKFEDGLFHAPGFYLPTMKTISYGNERLESADSYMLIIDFDSEYIHIPDWIIPDIGSVDSKGTCHLAPNLQDIVIGFENLTLRIPSTVYTNFSSIEQLMEPNGKIRTKADCTFLRETDIESPGTPRIILGKPFLKHFYTVFNLEEKTVGFSTMNDFVPKFPVFEKVSGSPHPPFLNEKRVNVLAVIIIIAGIFVCAIRRIQKMDGNPSIELVSQNIGRGEAQYAVVNENEEQDAGEVTVEEVA